MEEKENSMEQPVATEAQVMEVNVKKGQEVAFNCEEGGACESAAGSIGKFKGTNELYSAYNNLQAEFTRKCQRLSELERAAEAASLDNVKNADEYIEKNPEMVDKILKHYLEEVQKSKPVAGISGGAGGGIPLVAPPNPKTLEEAKEVVKNLFK